MHLGPFAHEHDARPCDRQHRQDAVGQAIQDPLYRVVGDQGPGELHKQLHPKRDNSLLT